MYTVNSMAYLSRHEISNQAGTTDELLFFNTVIQVGWCLAGTLQRAPRAQLGTVNGNLLAAVRTMRQVNETESELCPTMHGNGRSVRMS
jgi:hypothetical protein